ncbi:MAG: hypothetical protein ACRES7_12155 [Gammaproteobacteria bacterium]
MEEDVATRPVHIRLFGADAVVLEADFLPQPIQEFRFGGSFYGGIHQEIFMLNKIAL